MNSYSFKAYIDHCPVDEEFELIYEAGLDDSLPVASDNESYIMVNRESESLPMAVVSVIRDAAKAGFQVVGLEDEDVLTMAQLATRAGMSRQYLYQLVKGIRGPGGFPAPIFSSGVVAYSWCEVADWLDANMGTNFAVDSDARFLSAANLVLRARAQNNGDGAPLAALLAA